MIVCDLRQLPLSGAASLESTWDAVGGIVGNCGAQFFDKLCGKCIRDFRCIHVMMSARGVDAFAEHKIVTEFV